MQRNRPPIPVLMLCFAFLVATVEAAEVAITAGSTAAFATVEEGRAILGRVDAYVRHMGAFDRMLRMDREAPATQSDFLEFAVSQVTAWPASERERIATVLETLATRLSGLNLSLPPRVLLVRTTGREEEGEAHTRGHAIVLPARSTDADADGLLSLLAHELFHIASRHDAALRERAYALVGFRLCQPIALPPGLARLLITNPDAPALDTYIEVTVGGNRVPVAPVLLTRAPFSLQRGVALHDYWQLRFLALERTGPREMRPLMRDGTAVLHALHELQDFFQQVGRNTEYLIHPEEILADNFALLIAGGTVQEPERLRRLKELLQSR